ncbi:MAG: type I-E CRISPR-associated protein Cas7/Cse4/CasC, partial [Methylococcus sp.]
MFLQIHTLTSYHATLLNRDDAGLAKRIPFGDATRLRVSSQCLKRHWRENLHETIALPGGLRTRHFFEREILPRLLQEGVEEPLARQLTLSLVGLLLQKSDKGDKAEKPGKAKKGKKVPDDQPELDFGDTAPNETTTDSSGLQVKQPILFGKPEADFLVALLKECAAAGEEAAKTLETRLKAGKANFTAMLRAAGHSNLYAGLEGALFGRFVTSDILARSDAAVHVAHAFTVHKLDTEVDYFTVVDDLNRDEETGAAHAGDMELGAGLFYGYVAVDVPLLISNLTGCAAKEWQCQDFGDARAVLKGLVSAIATVSPGAKLGATAPYAFSDFVLLETGRRQPRALANAYLQALPLRNDPMQAAMDTLGLHLAALDGMYGKTA